jgi:outer membrane biosynthesis protein TonB
MRSKYIVLAAALSVGSVSIAWSADDPPKPADTPAAQPAPAAQPGPAAQPAPAAQPDSAAQPAPAAQQAPAASSTSTEAAAKAPAKETVTAAQEKNLLARGYKKETHNGQTLFCWKEIPLGSRFETKHCGTAQDITLQEQQGRDALNSNKSTSR